MVLWSLSSIAISILCHNNQGFLFHGQMFKLCATIIKGFFFHGQMLFKLCYGFLDHPEIWHSTILQLAARTWSIEPRLQYGTGCCWRDQQCKYVFNYVVLAKASSWSIIITVAHNSPCQVSQCDFKDLPHNQHKLKCYLILKVIMYCQTLSICITMSSWLIDI